jgi:hypothetical protein
MDPQGFSVRFRIRHPHIDPAELSRQLGVDPQHAWRAGEPRQREPGEVGSGVYRETFWVGSLSAAQPWAGMVAEPTRLGPLAVMINTGPVQPQVSLYFTLLRMKRAAAFWREFMEQGGTIECLLLINAAESFQLEISQALLLMLVELKIALSIEVEGAGRAAEQAA